MNKKIVLSVVITFVITAFLTSYVLYLFQARSFALVLSTSSARMAPENEGGGDTSNSGFPGSQGSQVSASISFFRWIEYSVTSSWYIDYSQLGR